MPNAGRAPQSTADYAVQKTIQVREGKVESVPVGNSDIVNKLYCDTNSSKSGLILYENNGFSTEGDSMSLLDSVNLSGQLHAGDVLEVYIWVRFISLPTSGFDINNTIVSDENSNWLGFLPMGTMDIGGAGSTVIAQEPNADDGYMVYSTGGLYGNGSYGYVSGNNLAGLTLRLFNEWVMLDPGDNFYVSWRWMVVKRQTDTTQ